MANLIYLTLKGDKQGLISAGCSSLDSIGNKCQIGNEDKIFVIEFNSSITRAQNVTHHPIDFIKPIDKSSPLILMAISNNEKLTLELEFFRTSQNGSQEKYYSILIKGASIVDYSTKYPHNINHAGAQPEEYVSVIYTDITCRHHSAGTSGYSIREENIY
ncbi:Hcp family type VI secretion system effector [Xenorhabdus bovienii]|uniref:Hcp family type VI secretion system effector n=1 Tax=Xenorhabdus bovienii TaxID=40576 RepID=UPI0023B29216|nr:Hcp family type VI secretion system effector [Xenorhabdus bovienii]MDE9443293.1 Hcp family type VI secretion system effector [Xenorhabdus bovienii]MDE9493892.1 Hcp family type VI secretion system effector [Xenorhabdus bovienii]MDE9502427.1 Hcp family type VI secretion system effector [Xenorhabdus bovienii]MDE9518607.1 Hcp family type VI secretion system effector [Xenorhabdus bovienii]MDE9526182.1 Hcp family type VI secretion system effector [Xenorhabdus bovienii]